MRKAYGISILICLLIPFMMPAQQAMVSTITPQFNGSGGVKLGPDGKLYIANFGTALGNADGTEVWRLDTLSGGTPTLFATGLQGASGNSFNSTGNLYQSNIAGSKISVIFPNGNVIDFASAGIQGPVGIAIDANDTLYVCNCGANNIRKISPTGVSTAFSNSPLFVCPNGAIFDHRGNLYVSNFNNGNVIKLTPDGTASVFATIPGNNNGHLTYYAPDSTFYVASHGSSSLYKVSYDGTVSWLAGTGLRGNNDGTAAASTFSRPNGMAISVTGDTLWLNSSIPTVDTVGFFPLNPSVVRMLTGLRTATGQQLTPHPLDGLELRHYPQPASENVHITTSLPTGASARLVLLDAQGRRIKDIYNGWLEAGERTFELDLQPFTAGLYYYQLQVGEHALTRKLVHLD